MNSSYSRYDKALYRVTLFLNHRTSFGKYIYLYSTIDTATNEYVSRGQILFLNPHKPDILLYNSAMKFSVF